MTKTNPYNSKLNSQGSKFRSIKSFFVSETKQKISVDSKPSSQVPVSEAITETKETENPFLSSINSKASPSDSNTETVVVRSEPKSEFKTPEKVPKEEAKRLDKVTLNEIDDGYWFPFVLKSKLYNTFQTNSTIKSLQPSSWPMKTYLFSEKGENGG